MCKIIKIDPFNTSYGPGIRVLIELSDSDEGTCISVNNLVDEIRKYRHYIEMNNGGITFKGNIFENLKYVIDTCNLCHKANINTCVNIKASKFNSIENYINLFDYIIIENDIDNIDIIKNKLINKIEFLIK